MNDENLFRLIPSVDEVLSEEWGRRLAGEFGRKLVLDIVRAALDELREAIKNDLLSEEELVKRIESLPANLEKRAAGEIAPRLIPLINATGIIIHTNIGRARLSEEAAKHAAEVATSYVNLEFDLSRGRRSHRDLTIEELLVKTTGAEASLVVNNNAGAVLLLLNSLAEGKEVILSRGELVEIGGSFRIPEVMEKSGAVLKEIGTTNKTNLADYERAISDNTALIMKVHQSNFRIEGFTGSVSLPELAALGRKYNIAVVEDLGSGCLVDLSPWGIRNEPTVQDSVNEGASLVSFSGDKLLGGPQAGVVIGKRELIDVLKSNPLLRALRADKLTYAALEATLLAYLRGTMFEEIPTLGMISASYDEIRERAERLKETLLEKGIGPVETRNGYSKTGGGSAPKTEIPTRLVSLRHGKKSCEEILKALRGATPPVIARIEDDRVLIDLRTVPEPLETILLRVIEEVMRGDGEAERPAG